MIDRLRALSVMSPTLQPRLIPYNQSIPIDMLFASPIPAAAVLPSAQSQATSVPRQQAKSGMMLLDSIFASVVSSPFLSDTSRLTILFRSRKL